MLTQLKLLIIFTLFSFQLYAQGEVYLVLGSDTGIWEGLNVALYNHTYQLGLYTDPARNAYKVMDPAFRDPMKDSYGTPLKMTWWMMSGNTFRYAVNKNVPHANSLPLYLMKKYHGTNVDLVGDELSLHYHTWVWTDYDKDGKYFWNQALAYEEFAEDFTYTLAENLLEENMFPISYRSGWHYMDNEWQNYLENVLPFSMHDDYPAKAKDVIEPLDNTFDWSKSSAEFVPFHPAKDDYQIPGDLKGWDVRSQYMAHFNQTMMNHVFDQAQKGIDQVVCIWAHLPEEDFLTNIQRIDSIAHQAAIAYPGIKFRYCTGVEAYQRWLKTSDYTSPIITLNEETNGSETYYSVQVDEPIFQTTPFVAVKDLNENYFALTMEKIGSNLWRSNKPVDKNMIVKIGVAATDTSGNLSTKIVKYLPDDIFIDNTDPGYEEIYGNWITSTNSAWGNDCRSVSLNTTDSALAVFSIQIPQTAKYNIFIQSPAIGNPQPEITIIAKENNSVIIEKKVTDQLVLNDWNFIGTVSPSAGSSLSLEINVKGSGTAITNFSADVIKISSLVREREISVQPQIVEFGSVSIDDTASASLTVINKGVSELTISSVSSKSSFVVNNESLPMKIPGMESKNISLKFVVAELGSKTDTLFIQSDDPVNPVLSIPCTANIELPFSIIDNEMADGYFESGQWFTSVAQAFGASSRYSSLNRTPKNSAVFKTTLKHAGLYDVFEIVPKTVNASDKAFYTLSINGGQEDSLFVNQNEGSGSWIKVFSAELPKDVTVELKVMDTGLNTVAGAVLRADAVKFSLVSEATNLSEKISSLLPTETMLEQNFPNPFNPSTVIKWQLAVVNHVSLKVYDILGKEIAELVNEVQNPGTYTFHFNSNHLASGMYFYTLRAGKYQETRKMLLLR